MPIAFVLGTYKLDNALTGVVYVCYYTPAPTVHGCSGCKSDSAQAEV